MILPRLNATYFRYDIKKVSCYNLKKSMTKSIEFILVLGSFYRVSEHLLTNVTKLRTDPLEKKVTPGITYSN